MTPREEAERIARDATDHCMGWSCDCHVVAADAIESALRAAEARGEQRGRVQGLREAADLAEYQADALDQQPPARRHPTQETPDEPDHP